MTMTERAVDLGHASWDRTDAYAEAVVDLDAIRHNTAILSSTARGGLMAVVKANAFGHGAVPVARTALASGATWLGVTSVAEALELREAGITAPVLAWMHLPDQGLRPVIGHDIDLAVASLEHLEAIGSAGTRYGIAIAIHLKVDTGLHRGGADPAAWPELVRRARALEDEGAVRIRGVWSHLARADEPSSDLTRQQTRRFDEAVAHARVAGLTPDVVHLANSAALLADSATHYDLARAGIALYGVEPIPGRRHDLRPAMTLRARTLMRRTVEAGAGVSYGHEYVTDRSTTLALVPLGYADGIPRAAGGRAAVLVGGVRRGVAGRVAMDQFVVDAGDVGVEIGDEVVVFGPGTHGEPTVEDWAGWAGTNPHEILTGIGSRVARRHLPADSGGGPNSRRRHLRRGQPGARCLVRLRLGHHHGARSRSVRRRARADLSGRQLDRRDAAAVRGKTCEGPVGECGRGDAAAPERRCGDPRTARPAG